MEMIEAVEIGTNRNGEWGTFYDADGKPEARPITGINLYNYGGCENLTLGQLVNAVCCRAGAALEAQSVAKMNNITRHSQRLNSYAKALEGLTDGTLNYDSVCDFDGFGSMTVRKLLTDVFGMVIGSKSEDVEGYGNLPPNVDSESNRLLVYTAMKEKLDSMTTESQRHAIDLQSDLARRDVVYSTATNIVRTLGQVLQITAANY